MASILNATLSNGLVTSADNSGEVNIQSNGTTVLGLTSTGTTVTGTQSVSGNLSFNSGYGSSVVAYGCRAWVNFNGTGTVAIRASGNVSSITDNGTGDYTVNFTNAMPDANYTAVYGSGEGTAGSGARMACQSGNTTTTQRVAIRNLSNSLQDAEQVNVSIFR